MPRARPYPVRIYRNTAASTAITGATEAETAFSVSHEIPANELRAGSVIRIRGQGIYTATTGAETHTIALKLGTVTLSSVAGIDPANNDCFYFDALVIVRTAGSTGTMVATGTVLATGANATGTAKPFYLASTTIDTTIANSVAVFIDRQTGATDADSARLDVLAVELIA